MRPLALQPTAPFAIFLILLALGTLCAEEPSLIAHWPLNGDVRDHSGNEHHGINRGVDLVAPSPPSCTQRSARFDGRDDLVEVANAEQLQLGNGEFSIAVWVHIAAVRSNERLHLYVNGKLVASSSAFNQADFDISNSVPLMIGFGPHDYFNGRLRAVRLYRGALSPAEVARVANEW